MREHDYEPVWGLPGPLPAGETVLWQGKPEWRTLARHAFHFRVLAAYLGGLWLLAAYGTALDQAGLLVLARNAGMACAALGVVAGFAWLIGHTTAYTVTNRRVVLRFGIALAKTINLPFALIDGANVRPERGDLALQLRATQRLAFLVLWPHVRPWRLARAEPMLRGLPDAVSVAQILGRALAASAEQAAQPMPLPADEAVGAGRAVVA